MDHCTWCLYGHNFTLIYTGSVLLNESSKETRNGKQKCNVNVNSCTCSKNKRKMAVVSCLYAFILNRAKYH